MRSFLRTFFAFFMLHQTVFAQQLQSPDAFLGRSLGESFTPHHLLVDYFKHVAANTSNMQLREYGKTNENRPLLLAIISSKENMARLEDIRLNNLRRIGMIEGKAVEDGVSILWISMNVHGNEPASSETSMRLIYELASANKQNVADWLKNTVVLIDPCVNPDGYHRYTHWNNLASDKIPNPNADSREHREPWPYGRVNHYYFDLNRDWAWATQLETQQRLVAYKQWMPHIVPDFHEMGYSQPYYFAPAAKPYHKYITPFQRDFQVEIGKNHANYFDTEGWLYFTKEVFDLFYPSYGDTYPTYNGAIGMTYEQGGISGGRAVMLPNGNLLTLKDRIAHHLTTALSTLEMTSKNASRLTENFGNFFQKTTANPPGKYKSFIIKNTNPRGKINAFLTLLDRHQIRYGVTKTGGTYRGFNYATGTETACNVEANDIVISAHQPLAVLTQILLEPESELEDSMTYDITAWSLPFAYGMEAFALKERLEPQEKWQKTFPMQLKTEKVYAYVANWQAVNNVRFVSSLLQKGYKIRTATEPFELNGKKYTYGTLIITRADNTALNDRFEREIAAIALQNDQDLVAVSTGFSDKGADLGSSKFELLQKPNVAIFFDDDVENLSFGQLWYTFEQDFNMSVSQVKVTDLNRVRLNNFNIICITDGSYGNLDSGKIDRLKQWVTEGGRLILIGDAVSVFEDKKGFEITKFASKKDKDNAEEHADEANMKRRFAHYCDAERDYISESIPGAIFRNKIDNSHPLAFGLPDYYYSLKTSTQAYQPLKGAWNVAYVDEKAQSYGFVGAKIKAQMAGSLTFATQELRKGQIVYMIDNPLYRSFWYNGKMIFANAVLMPIH